MTTTAHIPATALYELHRALDRACQELPYPCPSDGTLWADLNRARSIVSVYLLAPIDRQSVAVEVSRVA